MKSKVGKTVAIIMWSIAGLLVLVAAIVTVTNMNEDLRYKGNRGYDNIAGLAGDTSYGVTNSSSNAVNEAEKVITKNRISIETKNITKTLSSIEELIQSYEGKIINKNVDLGDSRYGIIVIKIPSNKGNEFVDKINKNYDVSSYLTDVSDVTEQYFNTEKEIQNLQRKIKLYEELANQTSIKEIETRIQIIDKIFYLEKQIEYLQEQNKDTDKKIEYRDVTITLSAPEKIEGERNYWRNTAQMIISTFEGSFRVLVALITMAIPFGIFAGVSIICYRKIKKK